MRVRLITILLLLVNSLSADLSEPHVMANGEELYGTWVGKQGRIAAFKGIPFATPPVAELRWRAPETHLPRAGPQAAQEFASACMQGAGGVDWYIGVAEAFGHGPEVVGRPTGLSEDCLYLNVWTPSVDKDSAFPVMVFVHGGSNSGGWSYEPNYMGARLAARGVVVVTIAYRLGPFGFFSHPALGSGRDEPVANFALLDIRHAFQWVRENIGAFGGDPELITAFGESAGAFNLLDLLSADIAAGEAKQSPFRRLISQSIGGSIINRETLAQEQATGMLLAAALGLGAEVTAEDLRAIPENALLQAAQSLPSDHYYDAVIDGRTLTGVPIDSFRRANARGVDLMIGTNADEWFMYIDENVTEQDLREWVAENAATHEARLLAETHDQTDVRRKLDRLRTARDMLCPSRFLAAAVSEAGGQGWVYYFSRQRSGPGGDKLGAYHGTELPYVFGMHDDWMPTVEQDRSLTDAVMDYWVQFARTGNPNSEGRAEWPQHSSQSPGIMELGVQVGAMEPVSDELCELLGPLNQDLNRDLTQD